MNLNLITVPLIYVEKAVNVYKKSGLHLIVKSLPNYARSSCPDGITTFSLYEVL